MVAFRLLAHALRQLVIHPRAILLLGLPSLLVGIAVQIAVLRPVSLYWGDPAISDGLPQVSVLIAEHLPSNDVRAGQAAGLVLYLLLAVSWHRYVLLNEAPRLLRRGRARQAAGYALAAVLSASLPTVLMIIPIAAFAFVLSNLSEGYQLLFDSSLGRFAIQVALTAPLLRLTTALPGFALQHGEPLAEAWRATRGHMATFVALATLAVITKPLAGLWTALFLADVLHLGWIGASVLAAVLSWLGVLMALSLLTTLWGHFVEHRPLR